MLLSTTRVRRGDMVKWNGQCAFVEDIRRNDTDKIIVTLSSPDGLFIEAWPTNALCLIA